MQWYRVQGPKSFKNAFIKTLNLQYFCYTKTYYQILGLDEI